jgi:tetratricopeptide (TPR) repeat protein
MKRVVLLLGLVLLFSSCDWFTSYYEDLPEIKNQYGENKKETNFSEEEQDSFLEKREKLLPEIKNKKLAEIEFNDLVSLSRTYEYLGEVGKAIDIYLYYGEKKPELADINSYNWNLAYLFYKAGEYEKAEEYLEKHPKTYSSLKFLVEISIKKGNKKEAENRYKEFKEKTNREDEMLEREIEKI